MNEYIKIQKRDTFRLGILDENDKPKLDNKGNELYIEFDLEDINTIENYSKCAHLVKKAHEMLRNDLLIIDKKEYPKSKNKNALSEKENAQYNALKKYYKSLEDAMNLFLGKGGVQKIFGNSRYFEMFDDLNEMLKPIMPKLNLNVENIKAKIKSKYNIEEINDEALS